MLKTANETSHKSDFDRMAGWTGWLLGFLVVPGHPVILFSCLN
jgi:hypothetical protein